MEKVQKLTYEENFVMVLYQVFTGIKNSIISENLVLLTQNEQFRAKSAHIRPTISTLPQYNNNRTEWSPVRSVIMQVINEIRQSCCGSPVCLIMSMITDQIGQHIKSYYQLVISITKLEKEKGKNLPEKERQQC